MSSHSNAPRSLGRYAVRRRIGAGGFATVWLAYDEQLDSPVAVKVLADNWTEDHHVRQRFLEEGRYLRRVESPYVVSVYDAGQLDDGRPYLVMTYADQGTLADRLDGGGLRPAVALEVVAQVASGLQALHDRDIVHRDVKPANVLFRSVGDQLRAMVGDLGLGKALDASSRLTMVGGTPSYVAPEQAAGESPDARADQYSLAVLTYLLLTGRSPYRHASLRAAADPSPPAPLSTEDRPFPAAVEDVVLRALATDRDERWPDVATYAAALAGALAEVGHDDPVTRPRTGLLLDSELTRPGPRPSPRPVGEEQPDPTAPARPAGRRDRPRARVAVLAWSVAAVLALVAGVAGGWWWATRSAGQTTVADDSGGLFVTVPTDWEGQVGDEGWEPPNDEEGSTYPALAVGTGAGWNDPERDGEGVFVGLMPGTTLPDPLPQHPECDRATGRVEDSVDGLDQATVVSVGCPGGGVMVERVTQVAVNRVLWVQVRSDDRATANQVLDSVTTRGL